MDISAVIPVREGSSRLTNKIFLPFGEDDHLLGWKIEQIKQVLRTNRIFVSSNSQNVKDVCEERGVTFLPRSDYLSEGHQASFSEVITGIVSDLPSKHFAWIPVVTPLMGPNDYLAAFAAYKDNVVSNGGYDSLVAVNHFKEYLWDANKPINYEASKNHTISQNLPDLYRVTNSLYMRDRDSTLEEGYFLGPTPYKFPVTKIAGIDIDEPEDYEIAKALKPLYDENTSAPNIS